ncbi:MAG: terminase, partial [Roseibium sp.]|uniref:terminase n=1 Tax=Roseibium sp. TaxID=1936156 RepID=UPI0032984AAB
HDVRVARLAAKCKHDPNQWARCAFDWGHGELAAHPGPRAWQSDINCVIRDHLQNSETRHQPLFIAVASGHGIGKSAEMGMLINWALSTKADTRIVITANTEAQLLNKTSPEVSKWMRASITADWWDIKPRSIKSADKEHLNNWKCDFETWSKSNTQAFAGLHNEGKRIVLLFDEASEIDAGVWEVALGALTDENTEIIWITFGNPTSATGEFRECFRRMRHRWVTKNIDSRTVEGTNKQYLQSLVDDYGEDSDRVKVRVRGMFPSLSAKQFISTEDVDAAFGRELLITQYNFAPIIIGVDPAWEGDDDLEIFMRRGLYSRSLATIAKNDNDMQVAAIVARYEDELNADAVFVDAGYGTGIVSGGRTLGRLWQLVWFAGKATDPGYFNKRAEIWGNMRNWLKDGGAIPPDDRLHTDLTSPEFDMRAEGKIQLESKKSMKLRGIPSPNKADALALTFARDVVKKALMEESSATNASDDEYDPYG